VDLNQLAIAPIAIGCPEEKSAEMAAQLDKRARQLAAHKSDGWDGRRGLQIWGRLLFYTSQNEMFFIPADTPPLVGICAEAGAGGTGQ